MSFSSSGFRGEQARIALAVATFMLTFLTTSSIISSVQAPSAPSAWYDPSWTRRKPITIDNTFNPNTLTNYQVRIEVTYDSDMKTDFSDLRFTDSDCQTLLPHWMESLAPSVSANLWVKISTIPASSTRTIYMYYGNPAASSTSNGSETFEFFDDFETAYGGPSLWTEKQDLSMPRADPASAVYNGKLYVFGGYNLGPMDASNETYEYDPLTGMWTQKADMPTARWGAIAVECGGKIYVFAGTSYTAGIRVTEVYDPETDTWTAMPRLSPLGFNYGLMGASYGGKIHLFQLGMHYQYDPATDTYTWRATMPTPRNWATCAVVGGKIYVIGGQHYTGGVGFLPNNENEAYDPATNTWTTLAPMPVSKWGSARGGVVINDRIYVPHGRNWTSYFVDNQVYDPSTDSWKQKSPPLYPRAGVAYGVVNDKLYAVGGVYAYSGDPYLGLNHTTEYDPSTDTWLPNPWMFSDLDKVQRDPSTMYEGSYGLMIYEDTDTLAQYAQRRHSYSTVAVDLHWDVTDAYGTGSNQPKGRILLADTANPDYGSLYFYNDLGPKFKWLRDGVYTTLQDGSWNTWYSITIIWNGANSKVIINGTEYAVSAASTSSDRLYLGTQEHTKMFVDLVRVRRYSSPQPIATPEIEEQPAIIESCDSAGIEKNTFDPGDPLYVKGSGFKANTAYDIYVVSDVTSWSNGDLIPVRVLGTGETVTSNSTGHIPPTEVWNSITYGKYDIVVDVYENGEYDSYLDALDDLDVTTAGFFVIPEYLFGVILSVASCFAVYGSFWRFKSAKMRSAQGYNS